MSPIRTLLFLCAVFTSLAAIMAVFPREGIALGDRMKLQFPGPTDFFPEAGEKYKDISDILSLKLDTATGSMLDSTAIRRKAERRRAVLDSLRHAARLLQFPLNDKSLLHPFFRKLDQAGRSGKRLRVLHYGDSQIEGDRISGYIRYHLQRKFGGFGPGLLPAMQPIPGIAVTQSASENWLRFTVFGQRDSTVTHSRYGALASFSRFTPIHPGGLPDGQRMSEAWLRITKSGRAYENCRKYDRCRMYYGFNRDTVIAGLYEGENLVQTDTLYPGNEMRTLSWAFNATPESFTVRFVGRDSPDIYALTVDGGRGIAVDNIPMRGSAGTVFTKMDKDLLQAMYDDLEVELIILQFGGNVMPYMKDAEACRQYGRWFGQQIRRLQNIRPSVSIIVIGPSDMSVKEKDAFVTYPLLELVRDELKAAAFSAGAAYWDLYEVMGGRNSMPSWVNANPPLAATDYIHFSPTGARKVAEMFYSALMGDYEEYRKVAE